jgi:hypothetical protein
MPRSTLRRTLLAFLLTTAIVLSHAAAASPARATETARNASAVHSALAGWAGLWYRLVRFVAQEGCTRDSHGVCTTTSPKPPPTPGIDAGCCIDPHGSFCVVG